jgi:hypothetical protein
VVVLFHGWLIRSGRALSALTGEDVNDFLASPAGRLVKRMTRTTTAMTSAASCDGSRSAAWPDQLQKRLKQSDSSVALGLYLMRRTGLRVGELRRLARDCVRADHSGNHFLKVPLGKLDNERLVPLAESALAAAAELQRRAREQSCWLIEGARARPGLWLPRAARKAMPHQPRGRRECFGELIQIDGCKHHWFEDRGGECALLVYVDDATSKLMELRFVLSESAFDYFDATRSYLERHGKPVAFYSDKHTIFRAYHDGATGRFKGVTQFGRALADLNIDIICANSPQAKGRVERMNLTLQDRLVKELRLRGISTKEDANRFAPEFMGEYNRRFGRAPVNPHNVHRPLRVDEDLSRIFTWQEERTLTGNLVVHFKRVSYLVTPNAETRVLGGKRVRIFEREDGIVEIPARVSRSLAQDFFAAFGHEAGLL